MESQPLSYNDTIELIHKTASTIDIAFDKNSKDDGRIDSAIKEPEFLNCLKTELLKIQPKLDIEISKKRAWYDIKINNIPINLKITSGGNDNANNKTAIIYTLTGQIVDESMNPNVMLENIKKLTVKNIRNKETEYHYLVYHKKTKKVLLKSILDIKKYNSNPCNELQIKWNYEFDNIDYVCTDHQSKMLELLKTLQESYTKSINNMKDFAYFDFSTIINKSKVVE